MAAIFGKILISGCLNQIQEVQKMSKVKCSVDYTSIENDNGYEVEGVVVTCSKCGNTTESFGTSEGSIKRCLAIMNEECNENNFYVAE